MVERKARKIGSRREGARYISAGLFQVDLQGKARRAGFDAGDESRCDGTDCVFLLSKSTILSDHGVYQNIRMGLMVLRHLIQEATSRL